MHLIFAQNKWGLGSIIQKECIPFEWDVRAQMSGAQPLLVGIGELCEQGVNPPPLVNTHKKIKIYI